MKKPSRAMRLLAAAAIHARQGNHERAGVMLAAAAKEPSLTRLVASLRATPKAPTRQTASRREIASWPFTSSVTSASEPGEELRIEPDENGDREIQEAAIDDDLEMMGLGDDMVVSEAEDEDEDDESDEDEDEAPAAETAASRVSRALANAQRLSKARASKSGRR